LEISNTRGDQMVGFNVFWAFDLAYFETDLWGLSFLVFNV
jgi:hypothetical protein